VLSVAIRYNSNYRGTGRATSGSVSVHLVVAARVGRQTGRPSLDVVTVPRRHGERRTSLADEAPDVFPAGLPFALPLGALPPSTAWIIPLLVVLLVFVTLAVLVVRRVVRRAAATAAAERTEELEARVSVLESEVDRLRGRSPGDED
jgi:hypothetical protein